jgi:tetratricopeptide (TPR) repeat protein
MQEKEALRFSPAKILLLAILLVAILPVLILSLAEISIRSLAPLPPTSFFIKDKLADGTEVFRANYLAAKRFFPGNLARKPLPEVFSAIKPPKGLRIFILGESAARGEFLADFSFARILEAVLQKNNPDFQIEVINTGIPAINSWVINEITSEIVNYQPDLVIVFAGHNEFIGPYGPASVFSGNAGRLAAKAGIAASSLHLIRLLQSESLPEDLGQGWRGLDMFSKNSIAADDERISTCKENWQKNLDDITAKLSQESIKTIVCSVPVNFRDCPPFNSDFINDDLKKKLETLKDSFLKKNWPKLAQAFSDNQQSFSGHALAHWLGAQAQLQLGNIEAARDLFYLALNLDTFRVRMLPAFNRIAMETANKYRAQFVDLHEAFEKASNNRLIGEDMVYDHVHLTETGHYLAARELYAGIASAGIITEKAFEKSFPEKGAVWRLLGFSDTDKIHNLSNIIASFKTPPFSRQFANEIRVQRFQKELDEIKKRDQKEQIAASIYNTTASLNNFKKDYRSSLRLAQIYMQSGHSAEAQAYFNVSLKNNPFNIDALNNLGTLFYANGHIEESRKLFNKALHLAPNFANAHFNLALCASKENRIEQAIDHYLAAIRIEPGYAAAMRNLANLYFEKKEYLTAEMYYQMAFSENPDDINSLIGSGNAALAKKELDRARETFENVIHFFPDRPEGYYSLGILHEKHNRIDVAIPFLITALQRFKHKPSADRVFNLIASGKLATSTENLQSIALACCETSEYADPWHLQLLAVTCAENGEKERAASLLHQALPLARKLNETVLVNDLEQSIRALNSQ